MESDSVSKSVTEETIVSLAEPSRDTNDVPIRIVSNGNNQGSTDNTDLDMTNRPSDPVPLPRTKLSSQVSVRSELDEVDYDRLSQLSLHMVKDFRYYFQAPYLRLFIAYLVVFCNFLIYAEDPVAHSVTECSIPVIGNAFAFVATRYPPNAWSLLKVVLWLAALASGIVLGKLLHVFILNRFLRLKPFSGDEGSWMIMFFVTILCLFLFSYIYNLFLLAGGEGTEPYRISSLMGISNATFMRMAACGTWLGDLFTAWMVTDVMLQERLYPNWSVRLRKWWKTGYRRIVLFWVVVVGCTTIVVSVISTDIIRWDTLNRGFLPSDELSRAFLASFILVMDLLIVIQDWDFPHFYTNFDVKLPGVNVVSVQFDVPRWLKEDWRVHITGKWFNYGILFMVMLLDLNMWKNQIFYEPFNFGQYVGPDQHIYTVTNLTQLAMFNETYLTYAWRSNNTIANNNETLYSSQDLFMNARFLGYHLGLKSVAFIPSIAAFIVFGLLVAVYGRFTVSEGKRYFGRMKKRRFTTRKTSRRHYRPKRTASAASGPVHVCPTIAEEDRDDAAGIGGDLKETGRKKRGFLVRSRAFDEEAADHRGSGEQNGSNQRPELCLELKDKEKEVETIIP